jgi:peptidoglycan/xylan/chitin deacetylase (PgdA/CDA1 family)
MKIAITFDIERDLPQVLDTFNGITKGIPKILKLLEKFEIKATFFCTRRVAHKYASYVRLIESNDHEIACHGWNHERLSDLPFEKSFQLIKKSKKMLQETCENSEVVGFRSPYLSPPEKLFEILNDLDFKYDSSITSKKKTMELERKKEKIKEFNPSKRSGYFRFPLANKKLKKGKFCDNLLVLYFHPWEFLNITSLLRHQSTKAILLKNLLIRPDRWISTGSSFEKRFSNLINTYYSHNYNFITLAQLCS